MDHGREHELDGYRDVFPRHVGAVGYHGNGGREPPENAEQREPQEGHFSAILRHDFLLCLRGIGTDTLHSIAEHARRAAEVVPRVDPASSPLAEAIAVTDGWARTWLEQVSRAVDFRAQPARAFRRSFGVRPRNDEAEGWVLVGNHKALKYGIHISGCVKFGATVR